MRAAIAAPEPPLRDGVVALRPFADGDAPALAGLLADGDVQRRLPIPLPYSERDARAWLTTLAPLARRGDLLALAITAEPDPAPLGAITLRIHEQGRGEVGYWLGAPARGSALAARALALMSAWAFRQMARERLQVLIEPDNEASLRTAERAGYRREGLLRSYGIIHGRRVNYVVLSLLPGDPAA